MSKQNELLDLGIPSTSKKELLNKYSYFYEVVYRELNEYINLMKIRKVSNENE